MHTPLSLRLPARKGRRSGSARAGRDASLSVLQAMADEAPALCLATTLRSGQDSTLTGAVLARVNQSPRRVGSVILVLDGSAELDPGYHAALRWLRDDLRSRGTALRLVIARPDVRHQWREAAAGPPLEALPIHSSLRDAVLVTYAALPGPGLVTAAVRAALAAPPQPVAIQPQLPTRADTTADMT